MNAHDNKAREQFPYYRFEALIVTKEFFLCPLP